MKVQIADTDDKIMKCWDVIFELRPHLNKEEFLNKTKQILSENVMMVFIEEKNMAVAAGVFRVNYFYHRGKNIYIDDLTTLPEYRSKGYGKEILDWIKQYAIDNQVENIHLDSGVHRSSAHKLYFNYGFKITGYHFALDV